MSIIESWKLQICSFRYDSYLICKTSVISHRTSTDVLQKWDTTVSRLGKNFVLSRDPIFPPHNKFKYTVMRSKSLQTLPPSYRVPMPFNSKSPISWLLGSLPGTCYLCTELQLPVSVLILSNHLAFWLLFFCCYFRKQDDIMNNHGLITLLKQLSTQGLSCFTEINFEKTLKSE